MKTANWSWAYNLAILVCESNRKIDKDFDFTAIYKLEEGRDDVKSAWPL